jgi:hypothetical protein
VNGGGFLRQDGILDKIEETIFGTMLKKKMTEKI